MANQYSPFITGISLEKEHDYLIELTALGVLTAIRSAVRLIKKKNDLKGFSVAIQGVGKVGLTLANLLIESGCEVIVTDINADAIERCRSQLPVKVYQPDKILNVPCDILIPCGLGGILNETTIPALNTKIICGAANNQLASKEMAALIASRGITYIPDYVANVGGAIYASQSYLGDTVEQISYRVISTINTLVENIINKSREMNITPTEIARNMVMDVLLSRGVDQIKADLGAWWIDKEKLVA